MFDIGFWEILLISVLALIIIGPERLPGAARKIGYWVGRGRRFVEGVRSDVESEVDLTEFKRLLHNQEVQINELQQKIQSGANDLTGDGILTDVPAHSFKDEIVDDILDKGLSNEAQPSNADQGVAQSTASQSATSQNKST